MTDTNRDSQTTAANAVSKRFAPLFRVTTFSKYFALFLIMLLPFVGGLVGYVAALSHTLLVEETTHRVTKGSADVLSSNSQSFPTRPSRISSSSTDVLIFEDDEVGISFSYPQAWGEVIRNGCTATGDQDAILPVCGPLVTYQFSTFSSTTSQAIPFLALGHSHFISAGRGMHWSDYATQMNQQFIDTCYASQCTFLTNPYQLRFQKAVTIEANMATRADQTLYFSYDDKKVYDGIVLSPPLLFAQQDTAKREKEQQLVNDQFEQTVVNSFRYIK